MIEDAEWSEFCRVQQAEIPATTATRGIVSFSGRNTFWADNFCAFTTGFTFTTHYRFDTKTFPELDPELWPDLTATNPSGVSATVEVIVDGELRTNTEHGDNHLHLTGGNSVPRLGWASWWAPMLPTKSLELRFRYTPFADEGSVPVPFDTWSSPIEHGVIPL